MPTTGSPGGYLLTGVLLLVSIVAPAAHGRTGAREVAAPQVLRYRQAPEERTPAQVLEAQLAAFNAHDVHAMTDNLVPDFVWYAVDSDGMRIELRGREAFAQSMIGYFRALPTARAEIEDTIEYGRFVAVRERTYWTGGDGIERSASALAVYEIEHGRIRRVWYYPAES